MIPAIYPTAQFTGSTGKRNTHLAKAVILHLNIHPRHFKSLPSWSAQLISN